jgi:cytidylate kinase
MKKVVVAVTDTPVKLLRSLKEYKFGCCHLFAYALQKAFEYKLYAYWDNNPDPEWFEEGIKPFPLVTHVWAKNNGKVYDANGSTNQDAIDDEYYLDGAEIGPITCLQIDNMIKKKQVNGFKKDELEVLIKYLQQEKIRKRFNMRRVVVAGVYDPSIFKAIFLAGGPGSGKSFIAGKTTSGHGFKMINSDDIFEHLLKKHGLSLDLSTLNEEDYAKGQTLRDKAKNSLQTKQGLNVDGRLGLVIDGTGRDYDKIKGQKDKLEDLGYDCYIIIVNTSLEVAQARNLKRARKLKSPEVEKMWTAVQSNLGKFQELFGAVNTLIVDNDNASKEDVDVAWSKINKFADRPISNHIAKLWIKKELEKKKR